MVHRRLRIGLRCGTGTALAALLALAAVLGQPGAARGAPGPTAVQANPALLDGKRVLLLSPFGFGRPGLDRFTRAYMDALVAGGVRSEHIMVEFLNLNRQADPQYRAGRRALLLAQYLDQPVDLIVTLQQPALDYALAELAPLAPRAPMISLDAQAPDPASLGQHALLRALPELDLRATLEQALLLFPATERLIVAIGAAPGDLAVKRRIEALVAAMGPRLAVEYTDQLPFDAMLRRVAGAPPHSIVLSGPINRDVTGALSSNAEMTVRVAQAARAPTFVLFSAAVGSGAVGGAVLHIEKLAARAGQASLDLLLGTRRLAPGIHAFVTPPTTMYDWRQLRHWGADPDRLPPDTLFVNQPPSLWQQHPRATVAALAVIALLSLLSAGLLLQRRHLRAAQAGTGASEQRFRLLVEHAPEAIIVYDVERRRIVDGNVKAERLFACNRGQLLGENPERFYQEIQPDGMPAAVSMALHVERLLAGEPLVIERAVRAQDGRCFPCEVRLLALPSAGGVLVRAGFLDISERKIAAQAQRDQHDQLEQQVAQRTAALSVALRDAESASRAKSVFLANMSHELRTPLNSVIGFSQLMLDSTSLFDEEKRHLALINRSGHQLLGLINEILELSKIEAGRVGLAPAVLDLGALLREVLEMVRLRADQGGSALALDADAALPLVLADGGRLRQVLLNLLSNAVKFGEGGAVTLSLRVRRDGERCALQFAVRDAGIGIAAADLERIFEPFVQADLARSQAGTGLGLPIARQFVALMGGTLRVRSAPGEGAEFGFTIGVPIAGDPRVCGAAPAPPSATADPGPVRGADLQALPAELRAALRSALQQLDMACVERLLAPLRAERAPLAAALGQMLARHEYRQLCDQLELAAASDRA